MSLLIRGGTVVTSHRVGPATVYVEGERIVQVGKGRKKAGEVFNAKGLVVLPGAVDAHVHFALPVAGTRSADDFYTGPLAAAAGGGHHVYRLHRGPSRGLFVGGCGETACGGKGRGRGLQLSRGNGGLGILAPSGNFGGQRTWGPLF